MSEPLIQIENMTLRAPGGHCLVHGLNLSLHAEECLGIAGESGCGKTMTAKAILRLLPPDIRLAADRLSLFGQDFLNADTRPTVLDKLIGLNVGFVPQNTMAYLHPFIKIKKQIGDGFVAHGLGSKAQAISKAFELLSQVGFSDAKRVLESYPGQLSGGMRQRVNIAMALMCNPKLIIADEPTTALDRISQYQVMELFHAIHSKNHVAMIIISHDLDLIRRYCERMMVMYAGQVLEEGAAQALFTAPVHPYTRALLSVIPDVRRDPGQRLKEIPGGVPEQGRDTNACLFLERCDRRQPACAGAISTEKVEGRISRCILPAGVV